MGYEQQAGICAGRKRRCQAFPILEPDAASFVKLARQKAPGVKVVTLKPGEEYVLG